MKKNDSLYLILNETLKNKCKNFYFKEFNVKPEHIDHYEHVNNLVYLEWFLDIAHMHSEALGYGTDVFLKKGAAFFVRKHEITYHQAARLGDALVLATWCGNIKAGSAYRYYELYKIETSKIEMSPLKKLTSGVTQWAYVNLKTREPERIPEELKNVFQNQNI